MPDQCLGALTQTGAGGQAIEFAGCDLSAEGVVEAHPLDDRQPAAITGMQTNRTAFTSALRAAAAEQALIQNQFRTRSNGRVIRAEHEQPLEHALARPGVEGR